MIVASMASLSSRKALLANTIDSLYDQVDGICVYLNGYKTVPLFLKREKIMYAILSEEAGWRGAEAKLWFWDRKLFAGAPLWKEDDIALVCDDDIIYPKDYAERHIVALHDHPGALVCVHGSTMLERFERYSESRMVVRMRDSLARDTQIHIPGTGTMAFRFGDFDFSIARDIRWTHCVDVMTAIAAKNQGVPVWAIARGVNWLRPQSLPREGTAIYRTRTGVGNDQTETTMLKMAGPWTPLDYSTPGFRTRASGARGGP